MPEKITMTDTYTFHGKPVRILCIDSPYTNNYSGKKWSVLSMDATGFVRYHDEYGNTLRPQRPVRPEDRLEKIEPFKRGEVVFVRNFGNCNEAVRVYSHMKDGKYYTFHITNREVPWDMCRRPDPDELDY